jgi:perosamine synthetase
MTIPITKPYFQIDDFRAVQLPLETGWVTQGPYARKFEEKFSEFTGSPFCIATSSCTTAMHLAICAMEVGHWDDVIVPAFTWISTPNVVKYIGAKPVFCDIDLDTFNIDTNMMESLITARTRAVFPVHLFGLCADMDPIVKVAAKHSLRVIEDAACAFGSYYPGKHAGIMGDAGCFSFHPRKAITTGEGGMVTTNNEAISRVCDILRNHGASGPDPRSSMPKFDRVGYNYRMTDIQASLGCTQIDKAQFILRVRRAKAEIYNELLYGIDWIQTPKVPDGLIHSYQSYVCLFRPEEPTMRNVDATGDLRNQIMATLEEKGIATRQGTHAPVFQSCYDTGLRNRPEDFPNAYLAERLTLTLPLYVGMTQDEQEKVVTELRMAFERVRRE